MKKTLCILSLVLALSVLFSCCAVAEEYVFTFGNGITWNSTPEEVAGVEGMEEWGLLFEDGNKTYYHGDTYSIAGYDVPLLYMFTDGRLSFISGGFSGYEDGSALLETVKNELAGTYGEPNSEDYDTLFRLVAEYSGLDEASIRDKIDAIQDYPCYLWLLPDGITMIYTADLGEESGVGLAFLRK